MRGLRETVPGVWDRAQRFREHGRYAFERAHRPHSLPLGSARRTAPRLRRRRTGDRDRVQDAAESFDASPRWYARVAAASGDERGASRGLVDEWSG